MRKILKLFAVSSTLLCSLSLTSCGENMDDYVGTWRICTSSERTYHFNWGSESVVRDGNVSGAPVGATITISKNKKVVFKYPNSDEEVNGKIAFLFGKAYFNDLNFSNDYKFELKTDVEPKILDHSWSEDVHGFVYDETHRHLVLEFQG